MGDKIQHQQYNSKKRVLLITEGGFVKHVKYACMSTSTDVQDAQVSIECPNCSHTISNKDLSGVCPGLPLGVKFKPTDAQLLVHLSAKCGLGKVQLHAYIDEFIPTVGGDYGICYTHPKNLPGVCYDGNACHVFYRICNAHARGTRKHRQIKNECEPESATVRWHLSGRPKPVVDGGVHLGYKKIFVLHSTARARVKSIKHHWILHQYHLGADKEEIDGQLVVGKVFFQQHPNTSHVSEHQHPSDDAIEGSGAPADKDSDEHVVDLSDGSEHRDIVSLSAENQSNKSDEDAVATDVIEPRRSLTVKSYITEPNSVVGVVGCNAARGYDEEALVTNGNGSGDHFPHIAAPKDANALFSAGTANAINENAHCTLSTRVFFPEKGHPNTCASNSTGVMVRVGPLHADTSCNEGHHSPDSLMTDGSDDAYCMEIDEGEADHTTYGADFPFWRNAPYTDESGQHYETALAPYIPAE